MCDHGNFRVDVMLETSFPPKRRASPGKSWGDEVREIAARFSSWPGLARLSTPWSGRNKHVDTRIRSAQDGLKSFPSSLRESENPGQPGAQQSPLDTRLNLL